MKKKRKIFTFLVEVVAMITAIPIMAFAATIGDTADVKTLQGRGLFSLKENKNFSIKSRFDMDFILERELSAGDVTDIGFKTSSWNMLKFSPRIFDRIEPYVRLGWSRLKVEWTDKLSGKKVEAGADSGFAWGAGIKALIYEFEEPNIKIMGEGSYRATDLRINKGYINGTKVSVKSADSPFMMREWQAALFAATEMDLAYIFNRTNFFNGYKLSPYGGFKYSLVSGRIRLVPAQGEDFYHPDKIKSDKNFGILLGFDLILPGDYASWNLEGRFIDETALSTGLAVLF